MVGDVNHGEESRRGKDKGLQEELVIDLIRFKGLVIIEVKPKVSVLKPLKKSPASLEAPEVSELLIL